MNDSSNRGFSLNDYVSEGQLFFKPIDKVCFEVALAALCDSHRHVVIVTDDKVIADRYYRYFTTRIAIRENITLDTRAPTGADDVLNRFNTILSASTVESARSADNNDLHHVMAMVDTSNMSDHEWGVLGRLLENFPGANIRILAFVSESQLDVIDSVLSELDDQVYRWILTTPTPEYLEALLEIGEQYNYQGQTQQMAAAMGYKRKEPKSDLIDELDALDAHLESPQNNHPNETVSSETAPTAPKVENDFDANPNSPLGAIKQSHCIDESQQAPTSDKSANTQILPPDSKAKAPSPRLIWTTGITGVVLILVALFAPWKQAEVAATQVQLSPRTFSVKTLPKVNPPGPEPQNAAASGISANASNLSSEEATEATERSKMPSQIGEQNRNEARQAGTQDHEPTETNTEWSDDMARILATEITSVSSIQGPRSDDTQLPESVDTKTYFEAAAMAITGSDPILDHENVEATAVETALATETTMSTTPMKVSDSAEQVNLEINSVEANPPRRQPVASSTTNPTDGRLIIQQAPPSTYFIQLGVYANQTQALVFTNTLPRDARAFQARLNKSGREMTTVLSGPFESRVKAEAVAASVLRDTNVWIRDSARVKAELGN